MLPNQRKFILLENAIAEKFHYYGYKTLPLFLRPPLEFNEHGVKNKRLNFSPILVNYTR